MTMPDWADEIAEKISNEIAKESAGAVLLDEGDRKKIAAALRRAKADGYKDRAARGYRIAVDGTPFYVIKTEADRIERGGS